MDTTAPQSLLERHLKELKKDRERAKCRNGLMWSDQTFKECEELITQYQSAIDKLDGTQVGKIYK